MQKKEDLFIQQNIILDAPDKDYIKKHTSIHKYYDNIKDPSYICYNNNIFAFKKYEFLIKHQERPVTDFVFRCCEWNANKRINYDEIFRYIKLLN